jgi:hypothetical protein
MYFSWSIVLEWMTWWWPLARPKHVANPTHNLMQSQVLCLTDSTLLLLFQHTTGWTISKNERNVFRHSLTKLRVSSFLHSDKSAGGLYVYPVQTLQKLTIKNLVSVMKVLTCIRSGFNSINKFCFKIQKKTVREWRNIISLLLWLDLFEGTLF